MIINNVSETLNPNDSAVVLFTDGIHLVINPDGSGTSGNWVFNPGHYPDKVIIYRRLRDHVPPHADIYRATFVGAVELPGQGRHVIHFRNARHIGTTNQNWSKFADTGANPVRYLTKR